MEHDLRIRQAREAARKFGKAAARGDCGGARKAKSAYIKAVSLLIDVLPRYRKEVRRLEDGATRMDEKLVRCYVRAGYNPPGWRR